MNTHKLKVRFVICVERDDSDYYAYCKELKGIHVYGDTEEEAIQNAKDGVVSYLSTLLENDLPLPLLHYVEPVEEQSVWKLLIRKYFPKRLKVACFEEELQFA